MTLFFAFVPLYGKCTLYFRALGHGLVWSHVWSSVLVTAALITKIIVKEVCQFEDEVGVEYFRVLFRLVRGNNYISRAFRRNGDNAPSYPEVSLWSLSRWKFARKGRREGENRWDVASPRIFLLPMVPWSSSPVTRVSRSPLCKKGKPPIRRLVIRCNLTNA